MKITKTFSLLLTALIFTCCMEEIVKDDNYYSSSQSLSPSSSSREATAPQDSILYNGQSYKTVKMGSQIWFAKNLNAEPKAGKSWCYGGSEEYDGSKEHCDKYGKLYDWQAAMSVCPDGWELPNKDEYDYLRSYENLLQNTSVWYAVFGGFKYEEDKSGYWPLEKTGYWWSSSDTGDYARYYYINKGENKLYQSDYKKTMGLSVRCIKKG